MPFAFDTGWTHPDIAATTSGIDDTQTIKITTHSRADALFRKIKANIEAHEDQHDLDAYMAREGLTLDALHLFDPFVSEELQEVYETHRACLVHGGAAREALPRIPTAQEAQNGKEGNERKENVRSGYW